MDIIIHPYQGIEIPGKGRISFGMTRQRVRSFFSEEPREAMVPEMSEIPTDAYYEAALQFFYKPPSLLECLSIYSDLDPMFQGKRLLQTPYPQIEAWFKELDPNVEITEYEGLTSHLFGIDLWAPDAYEREQNYMAECVFIFERGYYDK